MFNILYYDVTCYWQEEERNRLNCLRAEQEERDAAEKAAAFAAAEAAHLALRQVNVNDGGKFGKIMCSLHVTCFILALRQHQLNNLGDDILAEFTIR